MSGSLKQQAEQKVEEEAGLAVALALDADVLFFNGQIDRSSWLSVAKAVKARTQRRSNVLLVLITPGGDPDSAFKIGRCLQQVYEGRVFTYVPGWCKSAGTLVTLASKRVFIGDMGELGPLDIQIAKPDELFEMSSGLSVQSALTTLEQTAAKMFVNLLFSIRGDTGRGITTRTAAEFASTIVGTLLEPIYRQIEPVKIGENQRAMSITKNYGMRLAQKSGILKSKRVLDFLVSSYPDHGFVIDREEANDLFTCVEEPSAELERLAQALGDKALWPQEGTAMADVRFLSTEPPIPKPATKQTATPEAAHDEQLPQSPSRSRRAAPQNDVGVAGKRAPRPLGRRAGNGHAPDESTKD